MWREKAAAIESSRLKKLLLSNSAHEVRTPLNAIINYLEIALEGALDQETRDTLSKSHSASKSLVYVINDLLDLTKTEEGQNLINDEAFDLLKTVRETTNSFRDEASRKGLQYDLVEHSGIPQWVYGDQRRVRQAISNIIENAIDNTETGRVHVELCLEGVMDDKATIEVLVQDSGTGMSSKHLDALFKDLEQVTSEEVELSEGTEKPNENLVEGKRDRVLGLGLAVVARTVRNMNGQLRLKSEEGHGLRFIIQLPFTLADKEGVTGAGDDEAHSISLWPATENEITLVENDSPQVIRGDLRKHSNERKGSSHSSRSGSSRSNKSNKSDIDRMIQDLSDQVGKQEEAMPLRQPSIQRRVSSKPDIARIGGSALGSASAQLDSAPSVPRYNAKTGENTLIRAVRMPDDFPNPQDEETTQQINFEGPMGSEGKKDEMVKVLDTEHLHILVAEDDPVNNRIIKKRLERSGHEVHITHNGQECSTVYQDKLGFFDVVLMDMQVSKLYHPLMSEYGVLRVTSNICRCRL